MFKLCAGTSRIIFISNTEPYATTESNESMLRDDSDSDCTPITNTDRKMATFNTDIRNGEKR